MKFPAQENEIVSPISLCLPGGKFNYQAIGWTRQPLHHTQQVGKGYYGYWRNKRWEYWNVMTPTHIIALTVSILDYMTVSSALVINRENWQVIETTTMTPLSMGVKLPATLGSSPARSMHKNLQISIDELPEGTRLRAHTKQIRLDIVALRPAGHECLGVVVPWSEKLFQYTVKDIARPASGYLKIAGDYFALPSNECWAVLDHGRGRWPYAMTWNWGAGSGLVNGTRIGVQIGGKWTDGTGSTENALFVEGKAHKISEDLTWQYNTERPLEPWQITGTRVDLTFIPDYDRETNTNVGIIASRGHQVFGRFTGWMMDDTGQQIDVTGTEGWVEEIYNRW